MNSEQALENLVHCKSITKCKECKHKNRCTMERDYNIIKQDLEWKKWCVDVWGYKSITQLETRLESYSITLGLIKEFVEWLKNDRDNLETNMADKKGTYTTMVEFSCLEHILMKLKELGLYKEEK